MSAGRLTGMAEVYVRVYYSFSLDDGGEVDGVYATLEAAQAGYEGWTQHGEDEWRRKAPELAHYATLTIERHEVRTATPEARVTSAADDPDVLAKILHDLSEPDATHLGPGTLYVRMADRLRAELPHRGDLYDILMDWAVGHAGQTDERSE